MIESTFFKELLFHNDSHLLKTLPGFGKHGGLPAAARNGHNLKGDQRGKLLQTARLEETDAIH